MGVFLRLWQLGKIPEGFYSDEALYGYEAYSILKTGRDQFGNRLPLSIAGFGDYRPALYIYATIPFIASFGLNELAVRLPSALFGSATIVMVFLFVRKLTRRTPIALGAMFFMAISPWQIFFGRMAHETNLMTFLILGGSFFLLRGRKCKPCLVMALVWFGLSLYTYHTARVFVPLFLLLTLYLFRFYAYKNRMLVVLAGLMFVLLSMPLVLEFQSSAGWARVKSISIWNDPGFIPRVNQMRGSLLSYGVPPVIGRLFINKATILTGNFVGNLFTHLSPNFLLFKGDHNGVYNTPQNGILVWLEPLLFVIGAYSLWKNKQRTALWILGAVFFSLVPDALTRVGPSSARIHLAAPFMVSVSAMGLFVISQRKLIRAFVILILGLNLSWFWYNYLYTRPVVHESAWQVGTKTMILKAGELSPRYDRIWISRSGWGWIHLVFHTKYDPATLQKEIKISETNELGFWWVADIGKFHLEWLPQVLDFSQNNLYIATPREFDPSTTPIYRVKNPQGKDVYWFVDKSSQLTDQENPASDDGYL